MSTQELPEELIILGNGFDLACGLNSSYKSFFESYLDIEVRKSIEALFTSFCDIKELELSKLESAILKETFGSSDSDSKETIEKKYKAFEKKNLEFDIELSNLLKNDASRVINFFDIYFILNSLNNISYPNWSDVELAIQKLLVEDTVDKESAFVNLKSVRYGLRVGEGNKEILFIIDLLRKLDKPLRIEELEKRLLDDLIEFEENFKQNIKSKVYGYPSYGIAVEEIFRNLVDFYQTPVNILSFNYTNTLKNDRYNDKILNIENVHGTLSSKTVFGVDETAIGANSKLYMFTKTSRMMSNSSYNEKATPILHPNIKKIKFYGHSLSEMDYSYFQSIFDFYNLYGSNVQLFFYYSNYDGTELEDIKSNYLQSITKMIHKYGATMNNKDHGRNLQHKLLLEKRIHMIEI